MRFAFGGFPALCMWIKSEERDIQLLEYRKKTRLESVINFTSTTINNGNNLSQVVDAVDAISNNCQ